WPHFLIAACTVEQRPDWPSEGRSHGPVTRSGEVAVALEAKPAALAARVAMQIDERIVERRAGLGRELGKPGLVGRRVRAAFGEAKDWDRHEQHGRTTDLDPLPQDRAHQLPA